MPANDDNDTLTTETDDTLASEANDTLDTAQDDTLSNANDTVAAGAGDDTQPAAKDDTVAAGKADTTQAAADDTLAGDQAAEGFDQFDDAPAKPKKAATEDAPAREREAPARETLQAGETDDELTELQRELDETDETLGAGGKLSGAMKKLVERDKRRSAELKALQARTQKSEIESHWAQFEEAIGIPEAPQAVRKLLSRQSLKTRFMKHFNAALAAGSNEDDARGEARATLKFEAKQIMKQHGTKKPAPRVPTTSAGSRLSPPGGAAARATKPKQSAEDAFDNGNWSYPA